MKKLIPFIFTLFCAMSLNAQDIPDFILTDTQGNEHSLHETLARGQAVVIDFFATWCGPCQLSTVELNSFYNNNGAGDGILQVFSITIEPTDDTAAIEADSWGNNYPKFPFAQENMDVYNYYANTLGLGNGGIPFFIFICPNLDNPAESTIISSDLGYNPNGTLFNISYQLKLNGCETASYTAVDELESLTAFNLFPNPATETVNLNFAFDSRTDVEILVHNTLGQLVKTVAMQSYQTGEHSVEVTTDNMSNGMYILTMNATDGKKTSKFSVLK